MKTKIVYLCGSTSLKHTFEYADHRETLQGNIVLTPGVYTAIEELNSVITKEFLENLQKEKIKLANEILVLNVGGHIGFSTKKEIKFAKKLNKIIRYLE